MREGERGREREKEIATRMENSKLRDCTKMERETLAEYPYFPMKFNIKLFNVFIKVQLYLAVGKCVIKIKRSNGATWNASLVNSRHSMPQMKMRIIKILSLAALEKLQKWDFNSKNLPLEKLNNVHVELRSNGSLMKRTYARIPRFNRLLGSLLEN